MVNMVQNHSPSALFQASKNRLCCKDSRQRRIIRFGNVYQIEESGS